MKQKITAFEAKSKALIHKDKSLLPSIYEKISQAADNGKYSVYFEIKEMPESLVKVLEKDGYRVDESHDNGGDYYSIDKVIGYVVNWK